MSTQTDHLRASLERCGERAAYAERELARLMTSKGDARFARARKKLTDDLKLARNDVLALERALAEENARPLQDYIDKAEECSRDFDVLAGKMRAR
jgi:hypothetical protein